MELVDEIGKLHTRIVKSCKKCNGHGVLIADDKNNVAYCSCSKELFRLVKLLKARVPKSLWQPEDPPALIKLKLDDYMTSKFKKKIGLILHGPLNTGKTTAATYVVNRLINMVSWLKLEWWFFSRLVEKTSSWNHSNQQVSESAWGSDLLILDEVVPQALTRNFSIDNFYFKLKDRCSIGCPTIITTEIDINKWQQYFGVHSYRLIRNSFVVLHFNNDPYVVRTKWHL